jgi:hypothetical protein
MKSAFANNLNFTGQNSKLLGGLRPGDWPPGPHTLRLWTNPLRTEVSMPLFAQIKNPILLLTVVEVRTRRWS